jgi:hypothetical protein
VFAYQKCLLSLRFNTIFFPNGVSCETSSDFRRTTAHHRRGGKNPSEKRTDVAKQLGLPPSTLNTIIAKKKIREHAYMSVDQELMTCGVLCVEEMCGELGSGSCVEEVQGGGGDDNKAGYYGSTSHI